MIPYFNHQTIQAMSRRKTLAEAQSSGGGSAGGGLHRTLTALDLVLYGVGSSVGAGIFVLVGLGARIAGPAISLSFLGCGMACILTSLAYAEFAGRIPVSGSAFTYVYVAFGEFLAFVVGWNLLLGYGFTASATARAWGDYTGDFLVKILPVFLSTVVLLRGAKDSSKFNNIMTLTNLAILSLVVVAAVSTQSISTDNLTPFAPHQAPGVLQGAGLVFFAFIGFDMVASLSEEVVHPEKNMPIGIVGSLVVSTLIYVCVSLAVVGMASFKFLGETIPIVNALLVNACCTHAEQLQAEHADQCLRDCQLYEKPVLAMVGHVVSGGAMFGLMASCFTSLMGQPRILYRMAQDGLWFRIFAEVDERTQVPREGIKVTGIVCAALACFVPLEALASLISLGTLMVFTFVDIGVILLRLRNVSETTLAEASHPQAKEDQLKRLSSIHDNVVSLLMTFICATLGASLVLSNTGSTMLVHMLGIVALAAGAMIAYLPDTWIVSHEKTIHGHSDQFNCPWVPIIPLAGAACNSFMMGSLPLSSWLFCAVWLTLGVVVYFSYGIKHSTLGLSARSDDALPLMEYGGQGEESGYDSTQHLVVNGTQDSQ